MGESSKKNVYKLLTVRKSVAPSSANKNSKQKVFHNSKSVPKQQEKVSKCWYVLGQEMKS